MDFEIVRTLDVALKILFKETLKDRRKIMRALKEKIKVASNAIALESSNLGGQPFKSEIVIKRAALIFPFLKFLGLTRIYAAPYGDSIHK